MTPLIIALVSFATALVTGVLLSKAFFTVQNLNDSISRDMHHESLRKQRKRYRKQLLTLHNKAQQKLTVLRQKNSDQNYEIAELKSASQNCNATKEFYDGKFVESLRVEIAILRENLDTRDERVGSLELEIRENHVKAQELLTNLNAWKNRVSPLTKKLHEQRELIDDIQRSRGPEETSAFLNAAKPFGGTGDRTENGGEDRPDDLKKIRGIGPALERRLNTTGVHRFEQIAEMSEQDLMDLASKISISPAVAERGQWIQQARSLQDIARPPVQPTT